MRETMLSNVTSINVEDQGLSAAESVFTSICTQIAAWAKDNPDAIALADSAGTLTYGELVRRAGSVATRLRTAGVAPGDCVGVFLDRSPDFVVAALGIFLARAAYLPIDITSPGERVAFVLTDAAVGTVVTSANQRPRLPEGQWGSLVLDVPEPRTGDQHAPLAEPGPDDLAYVIYTSGSTGRPKGVELTHANLANLVQWHVTAFGVGPTDQAGQVASVGFDAAVWEIWPHLAAGATLHFPDDDTRKQPQLLRDWMIEQKITISFVPTALAEQVIHLSWPAGTALRTLLTGADVLHRRPPADLPFQLVNNYGPTECTVVSTSGAVATDAETQTTPSIGRPIDGATALILDDALRPVPAGEPGELCMAGPLVGRGYRNDPDLTAARFVTVACGDEPYARTVRVYRTGDQVRLLENGEIAFLGRLDKQVKIRGYRIEPAEIVAAIDRFPGVAASAVVAQLPSDGAEPELVAYVVATGGDYPRAADLRAFLASKLPEYMVPVRFVRVDALPMTINGKLDESALPGKAAENLLPAGGDPAGGDPAGGDPAGGVPEGSDSVQAQMAAVVASLLKLPAIEADENIFLVGGHSMLAMQLVLRIRQTFGVKLALREVFSAPTVAGLSAEVARRQSADTTAEGAR
ncbi:MAG TPA: non-ribosomal peptide synthetase [Pseudonocardia sp.]